MSDGFAQCRIDAGLPALSRRLESFEDIGVNPHVQRRTLHGSGRPTAPPLDVRLLPICGHCCRIIGVIRTIGCTMCNRRILQSLSLDAIPIRRGGFNSCFGHQASFLVAMRAAAIWRADHDPSPRGRGSYKWQAFPCMATKAGTSPVGATPSSRYASQTTTHRPEGGAPT